MGVSRMSMLFGLLALAAPMAVQPLDLGLQPVATGLDGPVAIAAAGDRRLFVAEQVGRVRIIAEGELQPEPFLDIEPLVGSGGERGLLGLAFHPDYAQTGAPGAGLFWVNYTDRAGNTVIARYRVSATHPDRADPASAVILLTIAQPFANHNGGQIAFGPPEGLDGRRYLYIGMGDGGSGGDPQDNARNDATLLGKLLRVDPATEPVPVAPAYTIPADNPNPGAGPALGTIWAKGLRNPWRFSFDSQTGELYIADVGQGRREEVNVVPAGDPGGRHFGWRTMEGRLCFDPPEGCDATGLTPPVFDYGHQNGRCSVTGGYVYRGDRFPALAGRYIFGDFCTGEVFSLSRNNGGGWDDERLLASGPRILTFGESSDRELYLGAGDGVVYRVVDRDTVLNLAPGSGLFAYPGQVPEGLDCEALRNQAAALDVRRLAPDGRFESCGPPEPVFPVLAGEGYLLVLGGDSLISSGGFACPRLNLAAGLNLIGLPSPRPGLSCFHVLRALGAGAVATDATPEAGTGRLRWCRLGPRGPLGEDFPIRSGEGYLVAMGHDRVDVAFNDPDLCGVGGFQDQGSSLRVDPRIGY